ncbi:SprT family zinc-dependent metalloprotease [Sulfurimonas sp.]|uniref:M48 family metallopeptidase n=1 Tax=Sulfurimonas sp. TaxID=2022749 RepID=UPI0025F86CCE|nr:SprT family zinc-dependent metalloprotease [Sulfurimonas sp.]MDD5156981.1 SprT family zinc-dependent metalloprotease [Sulfurimonas sp.]
MSVKKSGEITLKTPKVSSIFIQDLLTKKELWIRERLFALEQNQPIKVNLEDEVLLFYEIISIDMDEARVLREYLEKIKVQNEKNILICYDKFYMSYAKEYLPSRVDYFAKLMNLSYSELKFRKMKGRWGSCSSKGVITLNTQLIKIDKKIIDFIVVHELSHLVHMNHSKMFHGLVKQYIPDAKALNRALKETNIM